ncbi:MAG: glycosyltransferase [Thermoplasmatota archaeon]
MFISVVITVKNEVDSMARLLDSLLVQEPPFEIIVVDACSSDGTQDIVRRYAEQHDEVSLYVRPGSRGEGRNYGVSKAKGDVVVFIDGGCIATSGWLEAMREKMNEGYDVVAGRYINKGPLKEIKRVQVEYNGYDITYPSCNLAYKKELFEKIGGFDIRFITAEDIDLNLRAVDAGGRIGYSEDALIYRSTVSNYISLIKQSYWYGYGRKQLTLKHGRLWKKYSPQSMAREQLTFSGMLRLFFGLLGYLTCKVTRGGIR